MLATRTSVRSVASDGRQADLRLTVLFGARAGDQSEATAEATQWQSGLDAGPSGSFGRNQHVGCVEQRKKEADGEGTSWRKSCDL
jgi:hypothetical protein